MLSTKELLTVHEAAERLAIPVETVQNWAKKGLVRAVWSGGGERVFGGDELRKLQVKLSGKAGKMQFLKCGKKTGVSVIELFSGCGGMALGFERAGLTAEMLVEMNKAACATLRRNWPKKRVVEGDVAGVDFSEFVGKVDVVAGGFPCQAFSYAGNSRGFEDTRGTLFFEFARCLKEVRPRVAVGENVRGLLKHDGGRTLQTMLGALREIGYRAEVRLLRAQFLDVPQKR
ncbi:MAG: DNA (cytosine-5-)-methyltransferase, partial [Verrucomicrobiales bacterium]|nr:DNA (cytosine-5-)-methyltransferase [Verrucomicrobiales bacterium]